VYAVQKWRFLIETSKGQTYVIPKSFCPSLKEGDFFDIVEITDAHIIGKLQALSSSRTSYLIGIYGYPDPVFVELDEIKPKDGYDLQDLFAYEVISLEGRLLAVDVRRGFGDQGNTGLNLGYVKFFDDSKKISEQYGYITNGEEDFFFPLSGVVTRQVPFIGQAVNFSDPFLDYNILEVREVILLDPSLQLDYELPGVKRTGLGGVTTKMPRQEPSGKRVPGEIAIDDIIYHFTSGGVVSGEVLSWTRVKFDSLMTRLGLMAYNIRKV